MTRATRQRPRNPVARTPDTFTFAIPDSTAAEIPVPAPAVQTDRLFFLLVGLARGGLTRKLG